MSVNCSSANASFVSAPSPVQQLFVYLRRCYKSTVGSYLVTTFAVSSVVFLLPLYVFILRLGFKQWRQQGFSTVAMSHFDLFTYHMVLIEMLNVFASVYICCGIHANHDNLIQAGIVLIFQSVAGQLFFHILTCAERYLAVVHPVTYLSLKGERWIRARNVAVGFVWLLSILVTASVFQGQISNGYMIVFVLTAAELSLVLIFSLSALRVLIRSGPGEGNEGRRHVDPAKLRAFYVLVGVLVVLVLRMSWNIISGSLVLDPNPCETGNCGFLAVVYWVGFPTSLLMPLLYLQRKWKLLKRKNKPKHQKS